MNKNQKTRMKIVSGFACFMLVGILGCLMMNTIRYAGIDTTAEIEDEIEVEDGERKFGNILDCNGKIIASVNKKNKFISKDPFAYSFIVGSESEKGKYGMLNYQYKNLYSGKNVKLTIDSSLQEYTYQILEKYDKVASAIIMEAKTGKIKAMAFTPSYNNNEIQADWMESLKEKGGSVTPLQNPVVPGSIYKIVTSIGIIENGYDEIIVNDQGKISLGGTTTLSNSGGVAWGTIGLEKGFLHSSNVYFGTLGKDYLKAEKQRDLAEKCLIGKRISLDCGDVVSKFDIDNTNTSLSWTAIGQGKVEITVMNAAMIVQAIANDGNMSRPFMLDSVYSEKEEGRSNVRVGKIEGKWKKVTTEEVAYKIRKMMQETGKYYVNQETGRETVNMNGEEITIGLKTGTGDISNTEDKNNSIWIASMAPCDDPEYVVVMNVYGSDKFGKDLLNDIIDLYKNVMGEKGEE